MIASLSCRGGYVRASSRKSKPWLTRSPLVSAVVEVSSRRRGNRSGISRNHATNNTVDVPPPVMAHPCLRRRRLASGAFFYNSRLVNEEAGVSANMALAPEDTSRRTADHWMRMQVIREITQDRRTRDSVCTSLLERAIFANACIPGDARPEREKWQDRIQSCLRRLSSFSRTSDGCAPRAEQPGNGLPMGLSQTY